MKPAEIVTAVVSIPVVAALLVLAMTAQPKIATPAQIVAKSPEAPPFTYLADEIVVVAKRNVANPSS